MPSVIPITLIGDNLGIRHKYLNTLVGDAYKNNEDWTDTKRYPEKTPIDRLFKIDLASKYRDVNYIIENLKDDDMLYVSRSLKSKWLLDTKYQNIINPESLENKLYPFMVTTAVTKMKHWIHLHLTKNDHRRSEEFYKFYCEKEFEYAIKFLFKSCKEFIVNEFLSIKYKITPRQFKLLCETCPQVAKMFFDSLSTDEKLKSQYLKQQKQYFECTKSILKTNPEIFFEIVENYFYTNKFHKLSPIATKFVIQEHKVRFLKKPELYAAWLLDMKTLAASLTAEEAKDLIVKLARVKYLRPWFTYKIVEPLIKRLKSQERAAFKKKIFVEKDVGVEIEKCSYTFPSPPTPINNEFSIFKDHEHNSTEYDDIEEEIDFKCMLKKRKYARWVNETNCTKTMLDKLFDQYRFAGFEKTFIELKSRIKAESSKENRQYMMLVLVSKAGGRIDALSTLTELLVTHRNEPSNLRAMIVRSLVKKSFVWRLPNEIWKKLLDFAHNLGLDGKLTECLCIEGLHAVVLRHLLSDSKSTKELLKMYFNKFTTFGNYALSVEERTKLSIELPKLLLNTSLTEKNVPTALKYIDNLLSTFKDYKIPADTYPGLILHIKYLAEKDLTATTPLLNRLYKAKFARKQLFELNFELTKSDESYLNALRHNANILKADMFVKQVRENKLNLERVLKKIAIYFNEEHGIGQLILKALKTISPNERTARPINLLTNDSKVTFIDSIQINDKTKDKKLETAINSNAHLLRPKTKNIKWKSDSIELIANKVMICRQIDVQRSVEQLLKNKRTLGLALALAIRSDHFNDVLSTVALTNPVKAIKAGLNYVRKHRELDINVWENIKTLIQSLDSTKQCNTYLYKHLTNINIMDYKIKKYIPLSVKAEYNVIVFKTLRNVSYYKAMPYLCEIENLLPYCDKNFIVNVLFEWLNQCFVPEKLKKSFKKAKMMNLHIRILVKYLLLSETEDIQNNRLCNLGQLFFDKMNNILKSSENMELRYLRIMFFDFLDEILLTLKYTKCFIDPKYTSCIPLVLKFEAWMKTFLQKDIYFDKYSQLQITITYYEVIKQNSEDVTNIFDALDVGILKETVRMVGYEFGKRIAYQVTKLCKEYFESIVILYKDSLINYLDVYFCTVDSDFIGSIIKGICDNGTNSVLLLAVYMLKEKKYVLSDSTTSEITSFLKNLKIKEVDMFLNT